MKKTVVIIFMALSVVTVMAQTPQSNVTIEAGPFTASWDGTSGWECPEWFKDAKFGIWAHWGPQCQAEDGDWYARFMYYEGTGQYDWNVSHFGNPSVYGLKELCRDWKASQWDPDRLVKLYKDVGAKYFFTLGQHHDNFDLWDSPYQEWNSVNMGPKRDIVKEWGDACKKYGLPLGVSFHGSHTWTWMEKSQEYDGNLTKEDGVGTWWEGYDPQELYAQRHTHSKNWEHTWGLNTQWDWGDGASLPDTKFKKKLQNRILQCINEYNPDIIYFDDDVVPFWGCDEQIGLNILQHYYNHSANQNNGVANVVATGKNLNPTHKRSLLWDVERGVPSQAQSEYWQTCTCLGSWHYDINVYNRHSYKSAQQVIDMLVDIVSKNGNLLLSVPIRGNGTIDDLEESILKEIKAWLDINGESIFGTRPWKTFGEGPLYDSASSNTSTGFNEGNNYSSEDVRYVEKEGKVYATILRWPTTETFTFRHLGITSPYYNGKVESVNLLGYGELAFENVIDGLRVTLPSQHPHEIAPAFAITFGEPSTIEDQFMEIIGLYESYIEEIIPQTGYNTGKYNIDAVSSFSRIVQASKSQSDSDQTTLQALISSMNDAYSNLQSNGYIEGGTPDMSRGIDVTIEYLLEASNFSSTNMGSRFGTPINWTVENFNVPQQEKSKGNKNGIDNYPGYKCLMLGVWSGEDGIPESNMSDARLYRTVHLTPGQYYFGAKFQNIYNLNNAYIFASKSTTTTSELPISSIAYWSINRCSTDGSFYGINFTVEEEQDVVLGFQADLQHGSTQQEFRCSDVKLIYYGVINADSLQTLIDEVESLRVGTNTGWYSQTDFECVEGPLSTAKGVTAQSSYSELYHAYESLKYSYNELISNGTIQGTSTDYNGAIDLTDELLVEATHFSRTPETQNHGRYGTPAYWTVENYHIGNRNGIDNYDGSDCLTLGIWDDRQHNSEGDLSNARLYRKVHLPAGRYYFGAGYYYHQLHAGFIFASDRLLSTSELSKYSIAYERANAAANFYSEIRGINFTLEEDEDVILGWQADMQNGPAEQDYRIDHLVLLGYYDPPLYHSKAFQATPNRI